MNESPVEEEILITLLIQGDGLPANLADATGRHPRSVSRSARALRERGLVAGKGRSVLTLTARGHARAVRLLRERSEDGTR